MRKYQVVQIEWIDSHADEGWQVEGYEPYLDLRCISVGMLYSETSKTITITHSMGAGSGPHSPMTIPKLAIVSIKKIKTITIKEK